MYNYMDMITSLLELEKAFRIETLSKITNYDIFFKALAESLFNNFQIRMVMISSGLSRLNSILGRPNLNHEKSPMSVKQGRENGSSTIMGLISPLKAIRISTEVFLYVH